MPAETPDPQQQLESWVRQACLVEVRAEKPGNVTRTHSFADASIRDFEQSARIIAPKLAMAPGKNVGETILEAVIATKDAVGHNTNLGIILLLAPLATVAPDRELSEGIVDVIRSLTVDDAIATYAAINIASPGGIGETVSQDVREAPTLNLRACMQLAAERDLIAAQYADDFKGVLDTGIAILTETRHWRNHHEKRLAWVAVALMSRFGDTLVRRKCGKRTDEEVRNQARKVLQIGWPFEVGSEAVYRSFDRFLRADGNRRNPGTTADMIAAVAFAALREGICVTDKSETHLIFAEPDHE